VTVHFSKVAVIGTGALGGSVGAALRARGLAQSVCGHDPVNAKAALDAGLIDSVAEQLSQAIGEADLVVLAAPVSVNIALLYEPSNWLSLASRALVTDVSSTKTSVVAAALAGMGAARGRFVASHPIAGADRAGPGASRADLFEGAAVIVCPTDDSDADACERNQALWTAMGARVASMSAQHHDRLFAEVSHWPHAVAFALSAAIGNGPLADDARRFYGAGLRDTTRVGGSPADLWAGILLDNRGPTLAAAAAFRQSLDRIEKAIADGDRDALVSALAEGERWRTSL
jgi:prephenate dehydrogenase